MLLSFFLAPYKKKVPLDISISRTNGDVSNHFQVFFQKVVELKPLVWSVWTMHLSETGQKST